MIILGNRKRKGWSLSSCPFFNIAFLVLIICSYSVAISLDSPNESVKEFARNNNRKPVTIKNTVELDNWRENWHSGEDNNLVMEESEVPKQQMQREVVKGSNEEKNEVASKQSGWNNVLPVVINTWSNNGYMDGARTAYQVLLNGGSALDAVEMGCSKCEQLQCDRTVGYGGSPDENGETTLDAMIMDGETHAVGAVGCLRNVKNAIGVARKVLEHTGHTLLVGELATNFAVKMGFPLEDLKTEESLKMHEDWKQNKCQPNFWRNVSPDPQTQCGPYTIPPATDSIAFKSPQEQSRPKIDQFNHDTISMVVIDQNGRIASGSSSNGARNKIPGRVGDAPITGAGSYVDKEVGGAGATGDGDIMARFLPSLLAVEEMRKGSSPNEAAHYAISKIARYYPNFSGAIVAVNLQGEVGAACHNIGSFPYSYYTPATGPDVKIGYANCPKQELN